MGIFLIGLFLFLGVADLQAQEMICAKDLNNNGDVADKGEQAACTAEGKLCPFDTVDCSISAQPVYCPPPTQWDSSLRQCQVAPSTSTSCHWWRRPRCRTSFSCPMGTSLVGGVCVVPPTCRTGIYNPTTRSCELATCPLGGNFACINNAGKQQCSALPCVDLEKDPPSKETPDMSSYQNDSNINSAGVCQGQAMLFTGKPQDCRHSSASTNFYSCCNQGHPSLENCSAQENQFVNLKAAGVCHTVGTYCKSYSKILGCLQTAETACCFGSKLARIVHEQGRPQLRSFTGKNIWGQPETPECGGFTTADFQSLDFGKIDLSEYLGDKTSNIKSIKDVMTNELNNFQKNLNK
ncbi:MAG: conjugal transfer protein TraN [Deltaproteobacteria bacterium]|nr:conjugal transfer protein TraN [Deltaproteobacteria bacterium]